LGTDLERALASVDRALERDPQHPQATAMRYQALFELKRTDEAEVLWRQMAARAEHDWNFAKNVSLIATQFRKKTRLNEIVNIYLEHNPSDNDAVTHMANTFMMDGEFAAGHELVKRVAAVLPDNKTLKMTMALSGFRLRHFDLFHQFHRMRWERDGAEKRWNIDVPEWTGQALPDKAVLVYSEQGVGDHIMWAAFLPVVQDHATRVYVETNSRLNSLFARSFPEYAVVTREHLPPNWNTRAIGGMASAADIPELLNVSFDDVPGRDGFLIPDPALMSKLRARYQARYPGKKLVGISWRSGNRDSAAIRSLELSEWGPILSNPDCAFINLQYGDVGRDVDFARQSMGVEIFWDKEVNPLGNMDPFAAQVAAMDLVISVDNSTIHFAGALGKPTWALLPVNSDWRWLTERSSALWYKSLELFRQKPESGWDPIVAEIAARLRATTGEELAKSHIAMLHRAGAHAFRHGRLDVAEDYYRALLRLEVHRAEALYVVGTCARVAGHPKDAVAILAGAFEMAPEVMDYRAELALALDACGEAERAERIARDALKHDGANAKALLAMGRILCRHERQTEATDYFARVLRNTPKNVEARRALAQAQAIQGEWDLAKKNFTTAINNAPLDALSHVALGEAALRMGDLATGWEHFRWRFGSGFGDLPPHLAMLDPQDHPATWETGNLRKARLHLRAERSLFEQLLFASLLPDTLGECRSVLAEVDATLIPLLQNANKKVAFAAAGSVKLTDLREAKISLSSSLGDLARRFRADAGAFPASPWLGALSADQVGQWRSEYQQCFPGRPLVGLAWRNGDGEDAEHLAKLQPFFLDDSIGVVAVQRGVDRERLAAIASQAGYNFVVDPRLDGQSGLVEYAAQLSALDAVIAVDDVTAIVAGALGKPVLKIVANEDAHWAWGWSGASCVWSRNIHIMRKAETGAHWAGAALAALKERI
jgi:tetratricopeptide (TPR) repeat protein